MIPCGRRTVMLQILRRPQSINPDPENWTRDNASSKESKSNSDNCFDQLTGLYNRKFFETELEQMERDRNYPLTLVTAEINGLLMIRNAFGSKQSDKMRMAFAALVRQECRSGDRVARIGEDEFALLLTGTDSVQAERIIGRIRVLISKTCVNRLRLSAAFGYKTIYPKEEAVYDILKQAEEARLQNKLFEGVSCSNDIVAAVMKSLYKKSPREQGHSKKVSMICQNIGTALGMSVNEVKDLERAGLLHDIGKISMHAGMLNKNGILSEEEQREIKRHPVIGYDILHSAREYEEIADVILAHHERPDGRGYPKGLKEDEIPLKARILQIAEAFDVMTSGSVYQKQLSIQEAVNELKRNAGSQFDNDIVRAFIHNVLKDE
jgi:diguanylate cyclase (GGDEF)-like protein/putative nucleotidyltransferase with HDIG domain